jgi:hypothetical protein
MSFTKAYKILPIFIVGLIFNLILGLFIKTNINITILWATLMFITMFFWNIALMILIEKMLMWKIMKDEEFNNTKWDKLDYLVEKYTKCWNKQHVKRIIKTAKE